MKTTPSAAATTKSALERLVDWLTKQNETTPKHAGMFTAEPGEMIRDMGGYGDASVDHRPDFVRKDDEDFIHGRS